MVLPSQGSANPRTIRDEIERLSFYGGQRFEGTKPSDFYYSAFDLDAQWTNAGFTNVAGSWLMAFSKKGWQYPAMTFECRWPTMAANMLAGIGIESGGRLPVGMAKFVLEATQFRVWFGSAGTLFLALDVTWALPVDYNTAMNAYSVKLNKCNAEYYVKGVLVAVTLFGIPETLPVWASAPYSLAGLTTSLFAIRQVMSIVSEPSGTRPSCTIYIPWGDYNMACDDGDPLPPREYSLYTENTAVKWNGLAPGGVVTSHPVPIWGYPRKTLHIQSDAAGTVDIQIYVGGAWRAYDTIVLVANVLTVYPIIAEAPIARCIYTPVGVDTIAVAEFYLS